MCALSASHSRAADSTSVLALIAGNFGIHFLPKGVIFRGARPRRQILRRTAGPCRYVVRHVTGTRRESGRGNYQCNQASHDRAHSMPGSALAWAPRDARKTKKSPRREEADRGRHERKTITRIEPTARPQDTQAAPV